MDIDPRRAEIGFEDHLFDPLGDGAVGSPEQFILDMEIRRSQHFVKEDFEVDDFPFDELCKLVETDSEFLNHDHTLDHFRELWNSKVIQGVGYLSQWDETKMLEKCQEIWQENLAKWEPPQLADDKKKALNDMLARAKKELL